MSFIFGGQSDDRQKTTSPVKLPQVPDTVRQSMEPTDREKIELQIIKVSCVFILQSGFPFPPHTDIHQHSFLHAASCAARTW